MKHDRKYFKMKKEVEKIKKIAEYITLALEASHHFRGFSSFLFKKLEREIYEELLNIYKEGTRGIGENREKLYLFLKEKIEEISRRIERKYKELEINYRIQKVKEEILEMLKETSKYNFSSLS